ncbi:hypothetical protein QK290_17730, partial [Pseudarthrobacter sp. AL07]|nr:hypothetical protein [Pseudarthrobacter sp. AL20]MDI3210295.1 hypothetical protein [Pseudarthrobacter sp. AL07]
MRRQPGEPANPADNEQFRRLDFDDPETLDIGGVQTLVLISAGTAEDDVATNRHENVITAAERDGVRHIAYTILADDGDHLGFALARRWTERRLRNEELPWTVLNGLCCSSSRTQLTRIEKASAQAPHTEWQNRHFKLRFNRQTKLTVT